MHRYTFRATAAAARLAALVVAALLAGCSGDGNGQTINNPFGKKAPPPAQTPDKANYFEMRKEGNTYVFSRIDSMNAFREGKRPAKTKTQQLEGKTVVFEDRGFTDYNRLVAEYKKAHNIQ